MCLFEMNLATGGNNLWENLLRWNCTEAVRIKKYKNNYLQKNYAKTGSYFIRERFVMHLYIISNTIIMIWGV